MAERSKAAVLKTADVQASQGSNPCLSATTELQPVVFFGKWRVVAFYRADKFVANFYLLLDLLAVLFALMDHDFVD